MRWLASILLVLSASAQDSVSTLAGRALENGIQDGAPLEARFNDPAALTADKAGNLFVADSQNHVIRKIAANGSVSTLAGSAGTAGFSDGTSAKFDTPCGLAISSQGDLFVSDTGNHVIRRIASNGAVTTIAGAAGQNGAVDAVGAAARFDSPLGIAIGPGGTIYVADCGNQLIRAVAANGAVTTVAGSAGSWGSVDGPGSEARFNGPLGLAVDAQGNLFVSDSFNHVIRRITPDHLVSVWAGAPLMDGFVDGDRLSARFSKPAELAFDAHGDLYVADSFNHAIRKISVDGKVSTVTGFSKTPGAVDGVNGRARLFNPYGLAFLPDGQLAIADAYNQMIREAIPPAELAVANGAPLTMSWKSIVGKTYQVQRADPDFKSWTNVGDALTATESTSHLTDTLLPERRVSIYRLLLSP